MLSQPLSAPSAAVKLSLEVGVSGYCGETVPVITRLGLGQRSEIGHAPTLALPVEAAPAVEVLRGIPRPVTVSVVRLLTEPGVTGVSGRATVISRPRRA